MDLFKTFILICSLFVSSEIAFIDLKCPQSFENICYQDYLDKAVQALEYDRWLNEPIEDVFNELQSLYDEPLLNEIMQSVLAYREMATDWHYSYKVDNVYLLSKDDKYTYLIAHVLELLNDKITDKLLILVIINDSFKIIDQQLIK